MSQDKRDIAIEKAKKIIEEHPDKNDYVCKYIVRSYDHNNNPTDNSIELDEFWEDCKRIIALPSKEQGTGAEEDKFAKLTTADKIKCVQGTPELLKAVQLLRAVFDAEDLKSFIRFTYTFEDEKKFEITFMPVLHTETYRNTEIPKNQE